MRLLVLSCESLTRATYIAAARSPHIVDVTIVPRNKHKPIDIRARLQKFIDEAEGKNFDAIGLVYGLCGHATTNLIARSVSLIIPRAHDCITLYLGSRANYEAKVKEEPGTYWYSQDYMERVQGINYALTMGHGNDAEVKIIYEELLCKHGKYKTDQIMSVMGSWLNNYNRAIFLTTDSNTNAFFEKEACRQSKKHGWKFERVPADFSLVQRLCNGDWTEDDFLIVSPGKTIKASYENDIFKIE